VYPLTGGAGGGAKSGPTAHPESSAKADAVTAAAGEKTVSNAKRFALPADTRRRRPNDPTLMPT